ncbi:MAG: hypothetical protein M1828_002543 [Chrysothrix sp. TS-e1954]|nr:MAG: hypothetical protein M1828_002543 [Chrysothrix sp. TS-e1954]
MTEFRGNEATHPGSWPSSECHSYGYPYAEYSDAMDISRFNTPSTFHSQHSRCTLQRFVNEDYDDPFNVVMDPEPYCHGTENQWVHPHHNYASTYLGRSLQSRNRLSSPDDTIFSSTSGSGHFSDSGTGISTFHGVDKLWSAGDGGSYSYGSPRDTTYRPHSLEFEAFDHEDGGVALHKIQSYPDHGLDESGAVENPPSIKVESVEGAVYEYKHFAEIPDYDSQGSCCSSTDDFELTKVHASRTRDNDSDYKPPGHQSSRRPPRNVMGRRNAIDAPSKVSKSGPSRKHKATHSLSNSLSNSIAERSRANLHEAATATDQQNARPFSCPLTPYGCRANFTSKNEWKRHVTSQHICLGFWRCNMCQETTKGHNDFNRKDLFVQHVRRMHSGARAVTKTSVSPTSPRNTAKSKAKAQRAKEAAITAWDQELERDLSQIKDRCWIEIRSAPHELLCSFCDMTFTGSTCTEEWLEHVGKHLGGKHKSPHASGDNGSPQAETGAEPSPWQGDHLLRRWLLDEGLIEPNHVSSGGYSLVDKSIVYEVAHQRALESASNRPQTDEDGR